MTNTIQGFIMRVTSKGHVTIPQDIREKWGLRHLILDVFLNDQKWADWSAAKLEACAEGSKLFIN